MVAGDIHSTLRLRMLHNSRQAIPVKMLSESVIARDANRRASGCDLGNVPLLALERELCARVLGSLQVLNFILVAASFQFRYKSHKGAEFKLSSFLVFCV